MANSLLPIEIKNDIQVVDSRLIAEALDIKHPNLMLTVHKYQPEIESFGSLLFETRVKKKKVGTTRQKFCYLNENQAIFIGTLSRNTQKVVVFKAQLVRSFAQARNKAEEALSPAQVLLKTVQQMVDLEQRMKLIEHDREKAREELQAIQQEGAHALYVDKRKRLDNLVKNYAEYKQLPVPQIYGTLYREFSLAYSINLHYRAKKVNKTPIAWLESNARISDAYELAKQLFVIPDQYLFR